MKKKYIDEQGVCPFCHKSNLAYGTAEFEDDMLMFPWECNNCGKTGEEKKKKRRIQYGMECIEI